MNTSNFKTKTIFLERPFPAPGSFVPVAVDVGYSSVKAISPKGAFSFPAYARRVAGDAMNLREDNDRDIWYQDESGELWAVGELAYIEAEASDAPDSERELYGRNRYYSKAFYVLTRAALALACEPGQEPKIRVQTGLPSQYLKSDAYPLKDVFTEPAHFALKVGKKPWKEYSFVIDEKNVKVMAQPMGALFSSVVEKDGTQDRVLGRELFSKKVVVFDPGFGTLDDFTIISGKIADSGETSPNLGMREVLQRTCDDIFKKYREHLSVQALIRRLDEGTVRVTDKKAMERVNRPFDAFLEKNCKEVCREALEHMKSTHNYFADVDYIIATGGTYEAWKPWFDAEFEKMEDLKIISANHKDTSLSNIFSNARGYYFRLCSAGGKGAK